MSQRKFSKMFGFVLHSGIEVFPVQMKRRGTGVTAFRVSAGGNRVTESEEVNEAEMLEKVLLKGYAVRCSSEDGSVYGLYKPDGRSVVIVNRYNPFTP